METKNIAHTLEKVYKDAGDFLPLNGTDYVEFYVGNAKQAAHYYKTAFGFQSYAYSGLETGNKETASYVLKQDKIRLVLTSPLNSKHPINQHIVKHGDAVKVIALWVDDATHSYNETVKRGAKPFMKPTVEKDEHGEVVRSGIYTYGETVHMFVERKNYIDHMVGNVGWNEMNVWVEWYQKVMGFINLLTFDDKQIHTEYSALMSKVMANGNGRIKFPINEPAEGKKKSQIEEYIEFYEGSGCQHIAVATDDILFTVRDMKSRGVEFLSAPPKAYYDDVKVRVPNVKEDIDMLAKEGILIDCDEDGYLLQIFTKPVEDRPTLFFEVIERHGAKGFGAGNFKALFESIEREQALRGTLDK